jgi:tRNA(Ile)-lysidine synthase
VNLPDIVKERLIHLGARTSDSFLVAVSGGADSTALLMAMHDGLGASGHLTAAHLDHGVRPGSGEDLKMVLQLSRTLGVRAVTGRLNPAQIAVQKRLYGSLEAALRKLRYSFLHETAEKAGSKWIVTGHTADDQAETILFRVGRGMNWRSLECIPGRRGKVLRPLIHVPRSSTWDYCRARNITPVTDPTNYDEVFARSRIRNRIIPGLEAVFDPDISDHLRRMGRAAGRLSSAEGRLQEAMITGSGRLNKDKVERDLILALPRTLQERVVMDFLWNDRHGFPSGNLSENALDFIRAGRNGTLSLPGNRMLKLSYGQVQILFNEPGTGKKLPSDGLELEVPGRLIIPSAGMAISADEVVHESPGVYPAGNTVLISRKCFTGSLWVRKRLPGDRFRPIGMENTKKVKDFLVDRKVPRQIRDRIPLVLNSTGEIIWIGGVEISNSAALTGEKSEKALRLEINDVIA